MTQQKLLSERGLLSAALCWGIVQAHTRAIGGRTVSMTHRHCLIGVIGRRRRCYTLLGAGRGRPQCSAACLRWRWRATLLLWLALLRAAHRLLPCCLHLRHSLQALGSLHLQPRNACSYLHLPQPRVPGCIASTTFTCRLRGCRKDAIGHKEAETQSMATRCSSARS